MPGILKTDIIIQHMIKKNYEDDDMCLILRSALIGLEGMRN